MQVLVEDRLWVEREEVFSDGDGLHLAPGLGALVVGVAGVGGGAAQAPAEAKVAVQVHAHAQVLGDYVSK